VKLSGEIKHQPDFYEFVEVEDALSAYEKQDILSLPVQMKKEMISVLIATEQSPQIIRLWLTWKTTGFPSRAPIVSYSTF
jgi:hypothetical protein